MRKWYKKSFSLCVCVGNHSSPHRKQTCRDRQSHPGSLLAASPNAWIACSPTNAARAVDRHQTQPGRVPRHDRRVVHRQTCQDSHVPRVTGSGSSCSELKSHHPEAAPIHLNSRTTEFKAHTHDQTVFQPKRKGGKWYKNEYVFSVCDHLSVSRQAMHRMIVLFGCVCEREREVIRATTCSLRKCVM